MEKYLGPILTATVYFPLLAAVLTLPYMIYSYRKYGSVLMMRVVVMYAFIYYLLCVYCLAILPFPKEGTVVTQRTRINLIPFNYVPEVIASGVTFSWDDPRSWLTAIYSSGLYEPLCNVLMFMPLGVFLRYYFGCGRLKTVLIALGGSLFLELTQLSATYGLAPFVYRCCDVNDLIGNTLGGFLGYLITPLLTFFLPSRERLDQVSYQRGSRVSYVRRCFALVVDTIVFGALTAVLSLLMLPLPLPASLDELAATLAAATLYQGLLPALWDGRTLGKALVKIRLVDAQTHRTAPPQRYLARGLLLWGVLLNLNLWGQALEPLTHLGAFVLALLGLASTLALVGGAALNAIGNVPQMFYERWLHLIQISTVTREEAPQPSAPAP